VLGFEPRADELTADPYLPEAFRELELRGVTGRWGRVDLSADVGAAL
jgi:hypothetical protein